MTAGVTWVTGVTFAEISTLRFISNMEEVNRDIIIASTKLITGSSLLQTLVAAQALLRAMASSLRRQVLRSMHGEDCAW